MPCISKVVKEDLCPIAYAEFREHAKELKKSYLQRMAEEEKLRLEEMRRKSAETRAAAAQGM